MRKLFIGTMVTSLLGALVIGAALAWTGSVTGNANANAGYVAVVFDQYVVLPNAVNPTGLNTQVAETGFKNTGTVAVQPDSVNPGSASVNSTSVPACGSSQFNTPVNNVAGATNSLVAPGNVSAGSDAFRIFVNMKTTAVNDCQSAIINYDVTINVTT